MKFNPAIITNVGFIIVFLALIFDKLGIFLFNNLILQILYISGASLVIMGTLGYFMRKG